jgi:UPF0755 protein
VGGASVCSGRMLETASRRSSREPVRSHRRPRFRGLVGFLVILALLVAAAAGVAWYYRWCQGASGPRTPVTVEIPQGTPGSDVVGILSERDVIRCDFVAKLIVRQRGLQGSFIAGTYDLTTNMELDSVLRILTTPPEPVETVQLTIPEGWRITQIAERVKDTLGVSAERFRAIAESGKHTLAPYLPEAATTLEGFLFPKSYEFVAAAEITPNQVIREMLDQFEKEVASLPWNNAEDQGVTPYEVVIVASMIERETAVPRERPLIAGVIYNRLSSGEVLGIDATLLYDDPTPGDGTLTSSDLESDSPYNTRLHGGLPPTPIASPRLASIRAALQPADTDLRYYVACERDGPGQHRFARTLDQHNRNVAECLG